jgi:hypothetical protein
MNDPTSRHTNGHLLAPEWSPSAHGFRVFQRTEPIGAGISWEEAFILTRGGDDDVGTGRQGDIGLTIRSLTAPSDVLLWRLTFPVVRVVQRMVRRRYFRALR